MSPILFNIVVDMLAILIGRAKEAGQVGGLVPNLVDGVSPFCNTLMIQSSSWSMTWQKRET